MKQTQETLNDLAGLAAKTSGHLLTAMADVIDSRNEALRLAVMDAQQANQRLLARLRQEGADDPRDTPEAQEARAMLHHALGSAGPEETPLHLLSSPAARQYAATIRCAAIACKEMEKERGIEDGMAEILGDYADVAEMEVYGPVGLREG